MENLEELSSEELKKVTLEIQEILIHELEEEKITYNIVGTRIITDVKTVGVQGDKRSYAYPAEISIESNGGFFYDTEFISKVSTKITNQVREINKVVLLISKKE